MWETTATMTSRVGAIIALMARQIMTVLATATNTVAINMAIRIMEVPIICLATVIITGVFIETVSGVVTVTVSDVATVLARADIDIDTFSGN